MKAIETKYKGYRFRSRLEARWAVFFDALGMDWEYEPEGFDLGDAGWYLPDFWVPLDHRKSHPGAGYWCEIKATSPTAQEKIKAKHLAIQSGHNTIILCGHPFPGKVSIYKFTREGRHFYWPESDELLGGTLGVGFYISYPCAVAAPGSPDFDGAAIKARSARFEHGECPA